MNEVYLQRLKEDLRLKNYAKNTREDYYRFVVKFLDFTGKDAMSVTYADIRKFVFHMMDNESKKASTINAYTAAIRFFFEYTLGYVWDPKKLPKMKRDRYLPVVLTREQVGMLIDSMDNYKHKAITATMYSSGLRVSEVCRLRYEDISRSKKMIHVPVSKNRQDRYTILTATAIWRSLRSTGIVTAARWDGSSRAQSGTNRSRPAPLNSSSRHMPGH